MNRNPLPIVLPCHRVVGANGALTGYAGGLDRKGLLLGSKERSTAHFLTCDRLVTYSLPR